jgi:hypothetical protein
MSPEDVRLDPAGTDEFSVADQSLWKSEEAAGGGRQDKGGTG